MSEPAPAPQPSLEPHPARGGGVRVPETLQERITINRSLTQELAAAFVAQDADLQRLCELRQHQFLLACDIHDLERGQGDQRRLSLLPTLREGLAAVTGQLSELQQ